MLRPGASHARDELCCRDRSRGGARRTPNSEPNFLVPSWGSPNPPQPRRRPGPAAGQWGRGRRWNAAGSGGAAGGGGMWNSPGGPNVVTMASAGRTGGTGQSEPGFTPRPSALPMEAARWGGRDLPCRTGPPHPLQPLGGAGLVAREGATK